MHSYFAIIPARAGSKGIVGKNMQPLGGRPMLQYTLEAALGAQTLDYALLSSDDPQAIELAKALGVAAPFVRPDELAADDASTEEVVRHALDWHRGEFAGDPENIVLLQPTSPFRTAADIDRAIQAYEQSGKESLISVCEATQHPDECLIEMENGRLVPVEIGRAKSEKTGRQGYCPAWFIDGAIYIAGTAAFLRRDRLIGKNPATIALPKSHGIDIDTPFDLEIARSLIAYANSVNPQVIEM